jgi:hypothetical protein
MKTFEERIVDQIQHAVSAKILKTDSTGVLFLVTIKDKYSTRQRRGIFYPKEWQLNKTEFDDFELEDEKWEEE